MDRDGLERARQKRAWVLVLLAGVAWNTYLPTAAVMNWAQFYARPGGGSLFSALLGLPVFFALIHFLLVLPALRSGYFEAEGPPWRFLGAALLWAFPLASFAYWKGDFRDALHAGDFGVQLALALAMALILFARTSNAWSVSAILAWGVYGPLYLVDDILGPFSPLYVFAPTTPAVYLFRAVCACFALGIVTTGWVPQVGKARDRVRDFKFLGFLFAAASLIAALGRRFSESPTVSPWGGWDAIGFLGLVFFQARSDRFARRAFMAIAAVQTLSLFGRFVWDLRYGDGGWASQLALGGELLGMVWIGTEARRRWRQGRFNVDRAKRSNGSAPARQHS